MPQLPSGRHAGIDPSPLDQLIKGAQTGQLVHRLMAITEDRHVFPYIEVIELVPLRDGAAVSFTQESADRSCKFEKSPTGVTLDRLDDLGDRWSKEDLESFHSFVDEDRNVRYRMDLFNEVRAVQLAIEREGDFLARLQALWWKAGMHPAQTEGWQDNDSPVWDDYDLFVALSAIVAGMDENNPMDGSARHALMMTKAFVTIVIQNTPGFAGRIANLESGKVREMANELRDLGVLDEMPVERRRWFHSQGREAASVLCGAFDGDDLRHISREAANILSLVFVSKEEGGATTGKDK